MNNKGLNQDGDTGNEEEGRDVPMRNLGGRINPSWPCT